MNRIFRAFEGLIDPFRTWQGTPPGTLIGTYRDQLAPYGAWLPLMALVAATVATVEMGLIFYAGRLVDLMGAGSLAPHVWELSLVALFLLVGRPVLGWLHHLFLEQMLAGNLQEQMRWRAHRHLLGQPVGFFQNDFAGRLANRVMQLGPAVEDSAYMMLEAVWFALIYILGAAILMAGIDWRIAVPLLIYLAAYIWYVRSIALRVAHASEKWSDARSMVTGRVVDAYTNIETVKLFAGGQAEERYALSALRRLRLRFQRFLRLMTELNLGLTALNGLLIVSVVGTAIWLWSAGQASVGDVAAASALTIRLNGMSGWIMWVIIRLFEHFGVIREGLRSVAVPQTVTDAPEAQPIRVTAGAIRIEGLTHHYGKGQGGLDGVDLEIPAGQRVALVGRSGAGKSSLVNLLLRFRDPEAGRILIDGQDIGRVTQDSLRGQIGMVTQDSSLLHRSIRANILYGRPGATEAELRAAAARAEADFIEDLVDPKGNRGFEAQVGERGVKLSGGQRQRVALARVILKDAPILVLDEATSALDSEVEAAIQQTLYDVMEGKTVIAIAHRLSTIAQLDRIVVLDRGRVVEDGPHDALLAKGGLYASFWSRQSGGFLDTEAAE